MSSHSPLGIDQVFLGSCDEVSKTLSFRSPTSTLVSLSPTDCKFAKLSFGENEEDVVSDAERLSAFYGNAINDFYGTPSGALCVYKSGDAWPVRTGPESQRIIREARAVHGHPMQATWPALGEGVYKLLDDKMVRWTSIDPLAFAEAGKGTFSPLLIWIGVEPTSLTFELANTAAEAVTFLLAEAGFSGIEIGFRESVVTRSTAGPKMLSFDLFSDSVPEFRKPFTPALGLAIAPLKTPHYEGTGALYLRESNDSKRVFLLTCAHVARPPPVSFDTGLARKTTSHPREGVIALGDSGYTSALKMMMGAIGDLNRSIKDWGVVLRRLGEPQEGESPVKIQRRHEHLDLWTIPDQRLIGEVVHVEPIQADVPHHGFTKDWALIALHNDKFDWSTFMGNKVYVGGNLSSLEYGKIMFPHTEDQANYGYPEDGLLRAFGVVQPDEIHNPQHLDSNGEPCLLVVKNGLTTGTTIGRVTGMDSFTRVYKENDIDQTSREIAVLPYGNTNGPFSAPGDSGSIVLDRNGRILGMLTGGAGTTNRTDVTYLTPYWFIEKEIKKHFPKSFLYDVVQKNVE
ncbi:uncharacterized protein TRAVEDRAFT_54355 [Trametes versicolor FP-101664 SS1]|uniref:Trypsin-like serine protease n=1 Tax=Trametes versicolor (strain FP-101664) TaxID=717944 RepID=R7S7J3_TRAVS|nr:uncharacterized protein TRAVEDRAFT_54355 [Trametes versicolor FP-101664 SS1]EIW51600.1 hypothetical protein TRAVEDRAFT_54355 [Trametes versicolor FP-101664 SS1]